MTKTIIVAGFGPGISTAVAERFGKEGFQVALVARNAERLAAGVKALEAKGIKAKAFTADLGDPAQARSVVVKVRKEMGRINALQWTAYSSGAGDVLTADAAAVRAALDIGTTSLLMAVQEAVVDLKDTKGSVLVTNGGLGLFDAKIDARAVEWGSMGLAMVNSAKHKLVGLLSERLRKDDIFVGEVMVLGIVKGTAFDRGQGGLDPVRIGEKFWELHSKRAEMYAQVG
ncbi:MAG: SDR family NAD(P)-dependent oxidoreductase [Myxococcaceae bacterium]